MGRAGDTRARRRGLAPGVVLALAAAFLLQLLPLHPAPPRAGELAGDFLCAGHGCACASLDRCLVDCCCFPADPAPERQRDEGPVLVPGCGGSPPAVSERGPRTPLDTAALVELVAPPRSRLEAPPPAAPPASRGSEPPVPPPRTA